MSKQQDQQRAAGNGQDALRAEGAGGEDAARANEHMTQQMQDRAAAEIDFPTPDAPAGAPDDAVLRAELESTKEQLLRSAAEFQNYRRRTEQEKANLVEYGKSLVVQRLLDVLDDLERSIGAAETLAGQEAAPGPAYEALHQGVGLIHRKFLEELKRLGVEPVEAVGQPFDEHAHEALMQRPAPEGTDAGIVLDELQRGYRMGNRVLRHTKVVVAS